MGAPLSDEKMSSVLSSRLFFSNRSTMLPTRVSIAFTIAKPLRRASFSTSVMNLYGSIFMAAR